MKNLWVKQYLSKIKHNSKLVDMMSQLFTTNVMAEESKYFLFSLLVGLCRCMFNEATKIMHFADFYLKFFSKMWVDKLLVGLVCKCGLSVGVYSTLR